MPNPFDEYDIYIENLLLAQYSVSEIFSHSLTKGEIREDFIKDHCQAQYRNILIEKGQIANHEGRYSNQCDIIICHNSARIRQLGSHSLLESNDCKVVIEIKSNATGHDFKESNIKGHRIKELCSLPEKPLYGLLCYTIDLELKTILQRFGFKYDSALQTYQFSDESPLSYPSIDFVLSLHKLTDEEVGDEINKQFFIRKNPINGKYILFLNYPVSKEFFHLLRSYNI